MNKTFYKGPPFMEVIVITIILASLMLLTLGIPELAAGWHIPVFALVTSLFSKFIILKSL